jgi:phosphate-selective porin OprO and OprP
VDHSTRTFVASLAAAALALAAWPALAEETAPKKSVTEQVLDILREQGTIDDAKYDALKRQMEEEERARQAEQKPPAPATTTAAATPATPDPEGWKVYFKDHLRIERNDGAYKVHVGGMLQFDLVGITSDNALDNAGLNNQGFGDDFRRARLTADGELGEHLYFKTEYDFASGGDADFTDVFVGLQRLGPVGRFQAGHFKEPFSLEELTSDRFTTFMERALPISAFSPARNSGLYLQNTAFDQRLTWAVGGFKDVGDFGEDFSDRSNYNVTARITGTPLWENEGAQMVHVGYSYSHRFRDGRNDGAVTFAPRPEVNVSNALITTGAIPVDSVDVFGAELAAVMGPLSFQAEFIDAIPDTLDDHRENFYGTYAYVSWFVTGERRVYDPRYGAFIRTSPLHPFSLSKGQWGGLELAARYSYVDLNDGAFRGGIENDFTLGTNWYLFSNLRFMVNYVLAHRNGIGDQHGISSRFSIDF